MKGLLRGSLRFIGSMLQVAVRRLLAQRALAFSLVLGFALAVAALTSVPIYTEGSLQRVLQHDLKNSDRLYPASVHLLHLQDPRRPADIDQFQALDRFAQEQARSLIGVDVEQLVRYGAFELTQVLPVDSERIHPHSERWMALAFMSDLDQQVRVRGRLPQPATDLDQVVEVMVEESALDRQNLVVGAELWVPLNRSSGARRVKVVVVGSFERLEPNHPFWFQGGAFNQQLFVPEETFRSLLLPDHGSRIGQLSWYYAIKNEQLRVGDAHRLVRNLRELESRAVQYLPGTRLFEAPSDLLQSYIVRARGIQTLSLLLTLPSLAVVGYFLWMTAAMMVHSQQQEIAVLRSRGATLSQLIGLYVIEGLLMGLCALVLGFPLGVLWARGVGLVSGFLAFVDRPQPPAFLGSDFWTIGMVTVVSAMLFYLFPALAAARRSIVTVRREHSRAQRFSQWGRWGLEWACLSIGLYGYYSLVQGSSATVQGARIVDTLQLVSPALVTFGGALVTVRLMPFVSRGAVAIADRWLSVSVSLALKQLSRMPKEYLPVTLLITLTVGLGLFGAAAGRSLEQNATDRVMYGAGADVVLEEVWGVLTEEDPTEPSGVRVVGYVPPPWNVHYSLPGVAHAAQVRLEEVTPAIGGRSLARGMLMAINPVDFSKVAWFRDDLLTQHINRYLTTLALNEDNVLVDGRFAQRHSLRVGDTITLTGDSQQELWFTVGAIVDYWPTLYPEDGSFFVANLDYVESMSGLRPYQVWLDLNPDALLQPALEHLDEQNIPVLRVKNARQAVVEARRDPELHAVLGGLTSGFVLAVLVTVIAFGLFAVLRARTRVVQFGLLRALGLRSTELISLITLEQVWTTASGVLLGTLIGSAVTRMFVPLLHRDHVVSTPPALIVVDPADRVHLYLVLLVMLVGCLAGMVTLLVRLKIHEVMRMGEDHA